MAQRVWTGLGALMGLLAVAIAALTAHGLAGLDAHELQMVRDADQMQGWHALALLACGLWAPRGGGLAHLAGAAFLLGMILFSGAVYALAIGGVHLPLAAPVGGSLLMLGWLLLGLSALRAR